MLDEYKNQVLNFYRAHKRMPGYQELMKLTGFKSKNAVYKLINKLVDLGVVRKDTRGRLSPAKLAGEVPLVGVVEAGIPSAAEAEALDTLSMDEYLMPKSADTYLLKVKGDSMIEAGIREGDLVLVERLAREARDGEIVIAEVDGGWTMKYFRSKQGKVYLQPANKHYRPIYPEQDLQVAARVIAVIRKY